MMLMFGVRDAKADMFIGNPMMVVARGIAVRAFADAVNDPSTDMGKYPGDFTLFELAEYEPTTGVFVPRPGGILDLGNGLAFVNRPQLAKEA